MYMYTCVNNYLSHTRAQGMDGQPGEPGETGSKGFPGDDVSLHIHIRIHNYVHMFVRNTVILFPYFHKSDAN